MNRTVVVASLRSRSAWVAASSATGRRFAGHSRGLRAFAAIRFTAAQGPIRNWAARSLHCFVFCGFLSLGFISLAGCALSKPNPTKHEYLIETRRHAHAAPPRTKAVVKVRPFRVGAAFDQRSFVYRTGEAQYESDFYNQFLVIPGNMLAEQTRNWLADAGIFESVLPVTSELSGTFKLEGNITGLYGDFRDPQTPQAILAIEFLLLRNSPSGTTGRFQRAYRHETKLDDVSAAALAQGWNKCLEEVLKAFEKDLLTLRWMKENE